MLAVTNLFLLGYIGGASFFLKKVTVILRVALLDGSVDSRGGC
jgi:hypothetical protein